MRTRKRSAALSAAAVLSCASAALAVPQGSYWVRVNNSTNLAGVDTGFEQHWQTWDLFLDLEAGDTVLALDFGVGGGNTGLFTDGALYNDVPFSTDSVNTNIGFAPLVADLEYATAVTINGGPIIFVADPPQIDFDSPGWPGAWFVNPPQLGAGGPQGPDDMWVARFTISTDASFLGGQFFAAGTGPNGDFGLNIGDIPLGVVNTSFPPTPGAGALLAIGALVATRRRRA